MNGGAVGSFGREARTSRDTYCTTKSLIGTWAISFCMFRIWRR